MLSQDSDILNTKKEIELTIDSINRGLYEFRTDFIRIFCNGCGYRCGIIKVIKEGLISSGIDENNAG